MDDLQIDVVSKFLEWIRNHPYTEEEILEIVKDKDSYWKKQAKTLLKNLIGK